MSDLSGPVGDTQPGEFPCPLCRKADGVHARGCLTLLAQQGMGEPDWLKPVDWRHDLEIGCAPGCPCGQGGEHRD